MITGEFLDQWIQENRDSMIRELKDWVSHPSVSRADLGKKGAPFGQDCKEMLDFALERGRYFGFRTENHEGYCGDILYGDQDEELGFVCHLDVVPEGEGWIYEPYHPVEKNGYIIGRGASDNKGAAILVLWAFRYFKENHIPLKKTLRLMLGCAEETGMEDFSHYLKELHGQVPPLSIVADASFPVCYAQKGSFNATLSIPAGEDIIDFTGGTARNSVPDRAELIIRGIPADVKKALEDNPSVEVREEEAAGVKRVIITGKGKSGHAAFPEGTRNAIWATARAAVDAGLHLPALEFISTGFISPYGEGLDLGFLDEQSGKLTLNAGVIRKEGDFLKLDIDIRFPVSFRGEQIREALEKKLKPLGIEIEDVDQSEPYYIDPQSDVVKDLTQIYNEVAGTDAKPYSMGGGTYSRVIPDAVSYGPGFPGKGKPDFLPEGHGGAHGPDEVLFIEDWLKALKIYILTIYRLAA